MFRLIGIVTSVCVIFVALAAANAETFTGSLQYTPPYPADSGDGLVAGPNDLQQWVAYDVTLGWTVTNEDNSQPGFPWKYSYHFSLENPSGPLQAGISHMIIEASPGFSSSDILILPPEVSGATIASIGTQTASSPGTPPPGVGANPSMPEDMYGIKLDPYSPTGEAVYDWTATFYSDRGPVWGDFYARCGGKKGQINFAYDKGFTSSDNDPSAPASSGSVDFSILRPDSVVPEPSSLMLLAAAALSLLAIVSSRKRRSP